MPFRIFSELVFLLISHIQQLGSNVLGIQYCCISHARFASNLAYVTINSVLRTQIFFQVTLTRLLGFRRAAPKYGGQHRRSSQSRASESINNLADQWFDVNKAESAPSRKDASRLVLDSLKCLPEWSPVDVCIISVLFHASSIRQPLIGVDRGLLDTFTEALSRTEEAYLATLSLQDCMNLYRELLECSVSLPGLRDSCRTVQRALAAMIRSDCDLPKGVAIDVLLDTIGEEVDTEILQTVTRAIVSRIPKASRNGVQSPETNRLAKEILAIQYAFAQREIPVSDDFIEAVRKFILS